MHKRRPLDRILCCFGALLWCAVPFAPAEDVDTGYTVTLIDLDDHAHRQTIVDREANQYLGHPTTCLLEDGKTILCVYPKGHGRGPIIYKRSRDGGGTWSDRLPRPRNWDSSLETPTLHRVIDAEGVRRVILFSGLFPCRMAVSEDDGQTWSPLERIGDWGGIVAMGSVVPLATGAGRYMAFFHDDGRYFREDGRSLDPVVFTLYTTTSDDGGLSWSEPRAIYSSSEIHLCEPGVIRSPDGKQLAMLLRENARRRNSHVMFSDDEGATWTPPRELPATLTGDRHVGQYAPDGRLFISFRDRTPDQPPRKYDSPHEGDWVAWVGTYDDIAHGRPGQYRVRLKDNKKAWDCAYPGVDILPDGTFVTTTYGHWDAPDTYGNMDPYILSVRLRLDELDQIASAATNAAR